MKKENFYNGCFLVSRSIFYSEIWNKPAEYWKIFTYIMGRVNHSDNKFYDRGSNFFNFSEEKIPRVTKNQIYEFLRWAKHPNIAILTTQKTTRGIVIKVNNYNDYQDLLNYKFQDELQHSSNTAPTQLQNNSNTINNNDNNVRMKECNSLSLSKNEITQEEREILKSYAKKAKAENINAYIRKLLDNGDFKAILLEEKAKEERKKRIENIPQVKKIEEPEEITRQGFEAFKASVRRIK